MGQFLYFVEGDGSRADITPEIASKLAPVLADTGRMAFAVRQPGLHPSGLPGVLLRPDVRNFPVERFALSPDLQEWRQWGPGLWVGMWLDWTPGPEDLRRREQLEGFDVKLEDGNVWRLPLLKYWTSRPALAGESALPQAMEYGPDGEPTFAPLRKFRALCVAAEGLWQAIQETERREYLAEVCARASRIAPDALGLNYRVTAAECSLLQLVSTRNLPAVALALCDYQGFAEMSDDVKKNGVTAGAGPTTASGAPGS